MPSHLPADVPSPIDFRNVADCQEWAATAMQKRPWREEFFKAIVHELSLLKKNGLALLELGSGPGFLALHVLQSVPVATYVGLDFSPAMHALAKQRLGSLAERVTFLDVDFKRSDWSVGLPVFDAILSVQAIHELRHKRYAPAVYGSVRNLLREGGIFLVCDHYIGKDGMENTELYMTIEEQEQALRAGRFTRVEKCLQKGGLVLFLAA
jgi:cyclopropane fatty-acyl-phospholipid synthase-like methyltransferase